MKRAFPTPTLEFVITAILRAVFFAIAFASSIFFFGCAIVYTQYFEIFSIQAGFHWALGVSILGFCLLGMIKPHHGVTALIAMALCVLGFFSLFWEPFLRNDRLLTEWAGLYYIFWVYIGVLGIGLVVAFFNFIYTGVGEIARMVRKRARVPSRSPRALRIAVTGILVVCLGSSLVALGLDQNWGGQLRTITLTPGTNQIEFSGYGDMNPEVFSPAARESMDRHGFLLIVQAIEQRKQKCHSKDFQSHPDTGEHFFYQRFSRVRE